MPTEILQFSVCKGAFIKQNKKNPLKWEKFSKTKPNNTPLPPAFPLPPEKKKENEKLGEEKEETTVFNFMYWKGKKTHVEVSQN